VGDALRRKSAEVAGQVQEAAGELAEKVDAMTPDPILGAELIVGKPSWGYYVPTVGVGVLSLGVLAGVGALVYSRQKRKKR
jgi:hypothetical protein